MMKAISYGCETWLLAKAKVMVEKAMAYMLGMALRDHILKKTEGDAEFWNAQDQLEVNCRLGRS